MTEKPEAGRQAERERLVELRKRLNKADKELKALSLRGHPDDRMRLRSKAEGVRLARSYVDELIQELDR